MLGESTENVDPGANVGVMNCCDGRGARPVLSGAPSSDCAPAGDPHWMAAIYMPMQAIRVDERIEIPLFAASHSRLVKKG
jgi:hypothetical protein